MAGIATVTVSLTNSARLFSVLRPLAKENCCSFPSTQCFSSLGFCSLRQRCVVPSRKLVIRAARTESKGVSLGFRAPHFKLTEPLTGKTWKLEDFEAYPALLVMFICNHCPFVKHLKMDIVKLSNFYMKKGLAVVAISSNSKTTHPQDGPEFMAEEAKLFNYPFPYLYDESQDVARDFGAVCTPEFFLFKKDGRRPFELVYHGQFDDSRPGSSVLVTGRDLSLSIDCALSGQPFSMVQKPRDGPEQGILQMRSAVSYHFESTRILEVACDVWRIGKALMVPLLPINCMFHLVPANQDFVSIMPISAPSNSTRD